MVDLNFTLVVQLLMFLVFLWAMTRWVLRPLLGTMDERETTITADKEQAQTDQETAEQLEQEYAAALAAAHQQAHQKVAEALHEVQSSQIDERNDLRREQQEEIAQAREEANAFVEQQRETFPDLSKAIADAMLHHLGLGGDAS